MSGPRLAPGCALPGGCCLNAPPARTCCWSTSTAPAPAMLASRWLLVLPTPLSTPTPGAALAATGPAAGLQPSHDATVQLCADLLTVAMPPGTRPVTECDLGARKLLCLAAPASACRLSGLLLLGAISGVKDLNTNNHTRQHACTHVGIFSSLQDCTQTDYTIHCTKLTQQTT